MEDPGVDGRIILRWIFRKWDVGGMDWIGVFQVRDIWWVLLNADGSSGSGMWEVWIGSKWLRLGIIGG
jgi:hypothetical protein